MDNVGGTGMKILFLNASKQWEGRTYREYPYGIGILATMAEQAGFTVRILDLAVDCRDYMKVIKEFRPNVVAISFLSPSLKTATDIICQIKRSYATTIISGGIHSTLYPEKVLECGADIVMLGEGELTIVRLLECVTSMTGILRDAVLEKIPSLVYRDSFGNIKRTIEQKESVDLDDLPIMNRNLFDLSLYDHHTILTSRCCPYQCRFCCSWAPGEKKGG